MSASWGGGSERPCSGDIARASPPCSSPPLRAAYPDYGASAYGRSVLSAAAAQAHVLQRVAKARGLLKLEGAGDAIAAAAAAPPVSAAVTAALGHLLQPRHHPQPPPTHPHQQQQRHTVEVVDVLVSPSDKWMVPPPSGPSGPSVAAMHPPSAPAAPHPPVAAASAALPPQDVTCCTVRESGLLDGDQDNVLRVVAAGSRSGALSVFAVVAVVRVDPDPEGGASRLSVTEATLDFHSEAGGPGGGSGASVFGVAISPCLRYVLSACADGSARLYFIGPALRQNGLGLMKRLGVAAAVAAAAGQGREGAPATAAERGASSCFVVPPVYESGFKRYAAGTAATETLYPLAVYRALQPDGAGLLPLWCAAFNPVTAAIFATGGRDGVARLWTSAAPEPQMLLAGHSGDVTAVAFHPNAAYLLSGSADASIRVWDAASGDCVRVLVSRQLAAPVTALAVAPSGRLCVSGDEAGRAVLWDLALGVAVAAFPAGMRPAAVLAVAWAPAGLFGPQGVSGGVAGSAGPDVAGGSGSVGGGAVGSGGGYFALGDAMGTVSVWDTAPTLRRCAALAGGCGRLYPHCRV